MDIYEGAWLALMWSLFGIWLFVCPEIAHSHSSPGLDSSVSTKVLYFTDRSLTPFLVNIPKR